VLKEDDEEEEEKETTDDIKKRCGINIDSSIHKPNADQPWSDCFPSGTKDGTNPVDSNDPIHKLDEENQNTDCHLSACQLKFDCFHNCNVYYNCIGATVITEEEAKESQYVKWSECLKACTKRWEQPCKDYWKTEVTPDEGLETQGDKKE